MEEFKLTKSELEGLSKKIYEEACCGYMDLKDSVCERVISEFLDDKKPIENVLSNVAGNGSSGAGTYMGHGAMGGYSNTNVATYSSGTNTGNIYTYTIPPGWSAGIGNLNGASGNGASGNGASGNGASGNGASGTSEFVLSSNDVVLRDNTIDLRATGF